MLSDKEVKAEFKIKASKNPEKYYAVDVLKKEGFVRNKCTHCGTYFWATDKNRKTCGNSVCSGGYGFIGKSPAKNKMDYIKTWNTFSKLMKSWGYQPIPRYPVVARWRDDEYWVGASIYDFQPYVVSGEVKPPANPLVVPQFCLRFNDIDNVGITSAHFTGFVMIGQHAFMPPKDYNQRKYFTDIHNWLIQGLKLPKDEIIYHEEAWAGGGNFGPCMEFFSRGIELGNQVYMWYEKAPGKLGYRDLNIKVLDMGMGHERNTWFSLGSPTIYDAVFPTVMKKLYRISGIKLDESLMKKFIPYSSYLNFDETENLEKAWEFVAEKVNLDVQDLKEKILPLASLYSIGEHSRSLLVALTDGALPSNTGGGYNLRIILRRALSLIDKYGWKLHLPEICKWHAEYLKPLFPELSQNLDTVTKILEVEKEKYEATKQKSRQIIEKAVKQDITDEKLIRWYDANGISPEIIKDEAEKFGKKVDIPDNFYAKVAELHGKEEQAAETEKKFKLPLEDVPETKPLYLDDYKFLRFRAKVLKIIEKAVVLEKTAFYPTGGGQLSDTGIINNQEVVDVFRQGAVIVHRMKDAPLFKEGDEVKCAVDEKRRLQLAQHHTATHIVNAAARKVLGNHINQAGAKKTMEKAHIDLTHYQNITSEELVKIEAETKKIIDSNLTIYLSLMSRSEAEKKYGMRIYQGGAVPGKKIRIVEIPGIDVEACGGTHVNRTSEIDDIKILKSTKISDSVVRVIFASGDAAKKEEKHESKILEETAKLLGVELNQIPARAQELFDKWKKARKAVKKKRKLAEQDLRLAKKESFEGNILEKTAEILKTQPEHIAKTVKRFLDDLEDIKKTL